MFIANVCKYPNVISHVRQKIVQPRSQGSLLPAPWSVGRVGENPGNEVEDSLLDKRQEINRLLLSASSAYINDTCQLSRIRQQSAGLPYGSPMSRTGSNCAYGKWGGEGVGNPAVT